MTKTNVVKFGSFEVSSGKIHVSDPGYKYDTWCTCTLNNVLNGKYFAEIIVADKSKWGKRVAELIIRHENYLDAEINDAITFDGIGVDSGQAGFFDDDLYPRGKNTGEFEDTETFYGKACALTLSAQQAGILDNFGVVSRTGYGDGEYGLYFASEQIKAVKL